MALTNTANRFPPHFVLTTGAMFPSLRCWSARAHTPLIKFLGRRSWKNHVDTPQPHPAAPPELKQNFQRFVNTSPAVSSSPSVYKEFWEAPTRYWQPKIRQITEDEMELIMSGGASSY